MVALKSNQVKAFLNKPDPHILAVLIYGPDAGLVSERSRRIAKYFSEDGDEPGEQVLLEDGDLASHPERLAVELQTIPMFGGKKAVRVRAGQNLNTDLLVQILSEKNLAGMLIVQAGDLKKNSKLRQIFEKSNIAAAVPCFQDSLRDIGALIDEELKASGLRMDAQARTYLTQMLGADHGVSRAEIAKLVLYMQGKDTITIDDIDAIVGDSSMLAFDSVSYAVTAGATDQALRQFERIMESGQMAAGVVSVLGRHLSRLYQVRVRVDDGSGLDAAVKRLRPPVHFKRQQEFTSHCQKWSTKRILQAIAMTQEATRRCRTMPVLERAVVERLLMTVSRMGSR